MAAWFYTVEQRSGINDLSIASALQLSKFGLCNLKTLCCIRRHAKSYLVLSECFCYKFCLLSSHCSLWLHFANFAKGFSWISRVGSRHQWRTQKIFMGFWFSGVWCHLYLVCVVCDVIIWRHIHIFQTNILEKFALISHSRQNNDNCLW